MGTQRPTQAVAVRSDARVVRACGSGNAAPPAPGAPGLGGATRRALLAFVSAPQVLLDNGVGGAGADEGQARVNRFAVAS
jgi:hypothetical protein